MTITRALFDGARIHGSPSGGIGGFHDYYGLDAVYISGGTRPGETYTLRAYHKDATNTVHDTAQIHALKLDIEQDVITHSNTNTPATLNLTPDSSTTVTWASDPPGITGSGTSITFNPSTLVTNEYTVTATHNTFTNLYDTAIVRIGPIIEQIDIVVRKAGTDAAPEDGLIALATDTLEFAISPEFFDKPKMYEDDIIWQYRKLKHENTYDDWRGFPNNAGKGTKFSTTMSGGIYQIRIEYDDKSFVFLRRNDEVSPLGSGKKGSPDHMGVCDTQKQIDIRNSALAVLGSTAYAQSSVFPTTNGMSEFGAGTDKCNAFVAHRSILAGVNVPMINGYIFYSGYPPTANQWAGTQSTHSPGFHTIITGWSLLSAGSYPQPGYIVANPVDGDSGHCGIVDYDGYAIAAGVHIVHRRVEHGLLGNTVRYRCNW